MSAPYLSLVIPTRNDDYPGGGLAVQNQCLRILQRQLEAVQLDSEIIIVEYNADPSRPRLHERLNVEKGIYTTVRIIMVDPKYHRRFACAEARPFHQTCATNIGLRRARGRFAVYRAADHIYSDALIAFLGAKSLAEDRLYRCDRYDIEKSALDEVKPDAAISPICDSRIVDWHRPLEPPFWNRIPTLHTNACGDFLLMSRQAWLKVRGLREGRYPVFLDYDSLVLHACHALGYRQTILPGDCRVYKIDHGMKFVGRLQQDWTPAARFLDSLLGGKYALGNWARMLLNYPKRRDRTFEGVVLDSYERHFLLPATLWARGFPIVQQNLRWGLGTARLPERTLARAEWDVPPGS